MALIETYHVVVIELTTAARDALLSTLSAGTARHIVP